MRVQGEFRFPGRPEQVWALLLDSDSLRACIPGAESLEVVGLVEAVEDAERAGGVAFDPAYDDPVWSFGLDRDLVARFQPGALEGLDRQRDLVFGGDPGHAFTLS